MRHLDNMETIKSRFVLPLLALSALISACAPQVSGSAPVRASTSFSSVSFYPYETGLGWFYLSDGDAPTTPPYQMQALGPTVFQGQAAYATQLTGRGADQTWYRIYDASGVKLLGLRKPGVTITLSPAWQEYPASNSWALGQHWEGSSAIRVLGDDGKEHAKGTLKYRYDVQDQRKVTTPAGEFNVWVVTRQISDDIGGLFPAAQQLWFTPYLGEVRTPEGLILTTRNFKSGQP